MHPYDRFFDNMVNLIIRHRIPFAVFVGLFVFWRLSV